jgi:SNF2 family DNA or RNA helicase
MKYYLKTKPWEHQLKALHYLYKHDAAALYTDMGTGKTKVMIDLIQNRGFKRVLIVCPKKVCDVWESEIAKHGFSSKFRVINLADLGSEKRIDLLKKQLQWLKFDSTEGVSTVLIINYESVWREPLASYLMRKTVGIDTVICDESHKIKSPSSKCSKYLTRIGKTAKHRYLVTGTPLAENPLDVYAQYRFLDHRVFGTNYGDFRDEYENLDIRKTARLGYRVRKKSKPFKNLDKLEKKMFSIAFSIESTVVLPEVTDITIPFKLNKKTAELYNEAVEEGVLELNGGVMATSNILSLITRLQQIVSGYVPVEKDDGTVKTINIDRSRIEQLETILDGLPPSEPVVVFAKYTKDLKNIRKLCEEMDYGYSELSGKKDTLKEWKAGDTKVLGVQYKSGSEGIDLTRARYCIYYSLTHSLALYKQSRKRIHRPGQTRPCYYYHIVAKAKGVKTIDEKIMEALKSKQDVVKYIMKNLA